MQCATKAAVVTPVDAPHCADAGKSPRRADRVGSASVRPCRRRLLDRLPGAPGRGGRPDRVPGCACPAGWWTGDWRWESGGRRRPRRPWPRSCSGWIRSGAGRRRAPVGRWVSLRPCTGGDRGQHSWPRSTRWCRVGVCSARSTVAGRCGGPLVAPSSRYPWSLLWRAGDCSEHVRALVDPAGSPAGSADWNPAPARD